MRKILFSMAFGVMLAPAALAQRTFSSSPADSTRRTEPVIIVTEANAGNYFNARKPSESSNHSIKINPLLFFNGDIPVYFERRIAKRMTVEVGVGMTYKNYLGEWLEQDSYKPNVEIENEMGYSVSAALRYYPSSAYAVPEGYYFAPEIRHRVYNMRAIQCQGEVLNVDQQTAITDFKLSFGYVEQIESNIVVDFYGGVGMGNRRMKNEVTGEWRYDATTNSETPIINIANRSKMMPAFSLGVKFGFTF